MELQAKETSDDVNLYDIWKVIVKRIRLITGLFIVFVVLTAIASSIMPKIYKGETVLMVQQAANVTAKDIIDFVGEVDGGKKAKMLPNTYVSISDIKLIALRESKDKILVVIEAKNPNAIQPALSEIIEYLNNIDVVKQNIKEEQEKLLKRSAELTAVIEASSELLVTYRKLLTSGKLVPIGFNPVELNKKISDIKLEKLIVDQTMQRLKGGVEIASQLNIMNNPVKPKIKMNVALAGGTSILLGVLLAFILEYMEKKKYDGNA